MHVAPIANDWLRGRTLNSFYILQQSLRTGSPSGWVERYASNAQEDLAALWRFWVPAQIVNFSFCPLWLRIPFVATVSLAWTCVLSFKRGGGQVCS